MTTFQHKNTEGVQPKPPLRLFLFHQMIRHGAMTLPQLERLLAGRYPKSNLYRHINKLLEMAYLRRIIHPYKAVRGVCATQMAYDYGDPDQSQRGGFRLRDVDLEHVLLCTDAMIAFTFFENVTGVATEHEAFPEEWAEFVPGRIPDGIVQITTAAGRAECAVEIECSRKTDIRITRIIGSYMRAFQDKRNKCSAVIIIATRPTIHAAYQKALAKVPANIADRFILRREVSLDDLALTDFGKRMPTPGKASESSRTWDKSGASYYPLFSKEAESSDSLKTPISGVPVTEMINQPVTLEAAHE